MSNRPCGFFVGWLKPLVDQRRGNFFPPRDSDCDCSARQLSDMEADRVAWDDLKRSIKHVLEQWKPSRVLIENAHHGPPLAAELKDYHAELISTSPGSLKGESGKPGKLERATKLLNKLANGEVFLPQYNNQWLPELEAEWLAWTGMEEETSDQVDAAAYAACHAETNAVSSWGGVIHTRGISAFRAFQSGWN